MKRRGGEGSGREGRGENGRGGGKRDARRREGRGREGRGGEGNMSPPPFSVHFKHWHQFVRSIAYPRQCFYNSTTFRQCKLRSIPSVR
jgi:hypothetical protein